MNYIQEPPAIYNHPYNGIVIEKLLSNEDILKLCGPNSMACIPFIPKDNKCFIYLPWIGKGGVGKVSQDALRRHELAHCNGWRH